MLQLRLASTAAAVTTSPAVDSGSVSAWPVSGKPTVRNWPSFLSKLYLGNTTAYRYGRLDIFDPLNPDGFVQIGRVHGGPAFVPGRNIDISPALGLISPDEAGRTPHGHAIGDPRGPASRTMDLSLSAASRPEALRTLFELKRYCGLARDFSVVIDPEATDDFHVLAMQARFETTQKDTAQPAWDAIDQVWSVPLNLTEVL